jgi:hypothetical protein
LDDQKGVLIEIGKWNVVEALVIDLEVRDCFFHFRRPVCPGRSLPALSSRTQDTGHEHKDYNPEEDGISEFSHKLLLHRIL